MGVRRGEVLGLKWDDVDLDNRTLWVRRAMQRVDGELRFVEPKTHLSRRPLPIPGSAAAALVGRGEDGDSNPNPRLQRSSGQCVDVPSQRAGSRSSAP
jgi:hypothetical protein